MESESNIVFQDGRFLPEGEARVSPFDRGFLMGDGIFETLVSYDGEPFAVAEHHARLGKAAGLFGLEIPSLPDFSDSLRETVARNGLSHARIRVTITRVEGGGQCYVITAGSVPEFKEAYRVLTVPFCRNERGALASLKTTSYGENVVALKYAQEHGADEAVFGNTVGNLCEGTATNLFVIENDDQVVTPPISAGCLAGVTRGLVIDLCGTLGISCREADISLADFDQAEAAFLTSTLREVRPISAINGREISVSEITTTLASEFRKRRGS